MAVKIGIISDSHGRLRSDVLDNLAGCDYILHAGDIDRPEILDRLEEIAPVCAVRGNNDWGSWAQRLPKSRTVELGGVKFFLVHDRRDVPWKLGDIQVVVFGHSHVYLEDKLEGRLWLNPGSCAWPRFGGGVSMARLSVEGTHVELQKIEMTGDGPCMTLKKIEL